MRVDEEAADINGDVKIGSTDYILAKDILEDITDFQSENNYIILYTY